MNETIVKKRLLPKQRKFVKKLSEGMTIKDASQIVGYSEAYANRMVKKGILVEALDKVGLSDRGLAQGLEKSISSGLGVKATNSDAISGIRLAYELRGALDKAVPDNMTQNNVYINELKNMNDDDLTHKIEQLTQDIHAINNP